MSVLRRIVKIGGSLFDLPDLAPRVDAVLGAAPALIVPGGGPIVDAIRALDQVHQLGEEACHWLAIQAMSVNAQFLSRLLSTSNLLPRLPGPDDPGNRFIVDPLPFFRDDDRRAGRFPHGWDVTSDSLAVRIAIRAAASELLLLKSVSWQSDDWSAAARAGVVDRYFPNALQLAAGLRVRLVNLRGSE
jgi:aspartokinase-like uncharacterized kinase